MKEKREKCKKPADGVWGSDSRGCRPGEPFVRTDVCVCLTSAPARVYVHVEYASACDESGLARSVARAVESFYTRDQAICPGRCITSDKRYIIPCVVLVTRFTRQK
jgi:hypothetical protein